MIEEKIKGMKASEYISFHSKIIDEDVTVYPSGGVRTMKDGYDTAYYSLEEWKVIAGLPPDEVRFIHNIKTIFYDSTIVEKEVLNGKDPHDPDNIGGV